MTKLSLVDDSMRQSTYKDTGVDTQEADAGLARIVSHIRKTWPKDGPYKVALDIGYFANVIDIGDGIGIAICTDGVGSKSIIADMMRKYDTIGIDCVAMNVNDLICVGAKPISLVDYIGIKHADADVLEQIGIGLCKGAEAANISISGGEISQLGDNLSGFDLVGASIGSVKMDNILVGQDIKEGDAVIGVRSNGIHCNGLSLARRTFFEKNNFDVENYMPEFGCTLGEELLKPTDIYVQESMEILKKIEGVKALVNITSDGLLNLTRVKSDVGYVIDNLPEIHPVFSMIETLGGVGAGEMFAVFNMGVGFCFVVDEASSDGVISILKSHGRDARRIGYAVRDPEKTVNVLQRNLVGQNKVFHHA